MESFEMGLKCGSSIISDMGWNPDFYGVGRKFSEAVTDVYTGLRSGRISPGSDVVFSRNFSYLKNLREKYSEDLPVECLGMIDAQIEGFCGMRG